MVEKNIMEYYREIDRYGKVNTDFFERVAEKMNVSSVDVFVLSAEIHVKEGYLNGEYCTQQNLAQTWVYPKQTIHSSVERLKKKGLVTLEPIPGNKKEKAIVLTEEGHKLVDLHMITAFEKMNRAMLRLLPEERETLCRLMGRLVDGIEEEMEDL